MSYALNGAVRAVTSPPIADVHTWLDGQPNDPARPLLDLAQAVPVDPPPQSLRAHVAEQLARDGLHRYSLMCAASAVRSSGSPSMGV